MSTRKVLHSPAPQPVQTLDPLLVRHGGCMYCGGKVAHRADCKRPTLSAVCIYCGAPTDRAHHNTCHRPITCLDCGTSYHANERHGCATRATAPARPPAHCKEPPAPPAEPPRRLLSGLTSEQRKEYPITTGFLDYFPDATPMVAHVSYLGNQKHNPGQRLHWARGKSMDHEDCIARHTIERDTVEDDVFHAANRAWRAMAALQELLEKTHNLSPPRGSIPPR